MNEIEKILEYAKKMDGIKYTWWTGSDKEEDIFYCNEIPSMEKLKEKGINCAGLINVMRMYSGVEIPEQKDKDVVRGGTRFWYNYFNNLGKLEVFDYEKSYQLGTLLLRDYKDINDQGHMAVICEHSKEYPKKLLSGESLSEREMFRLLLAQSASQKDRKLSDGLKGKIRRWQSLYLKVLEAVSSHQSLKPLLEVMAPRAASINREDRVTGNALIGIVDEIMTFDKKNSDAGKIQAIIEEFIDHQTLNPDFDIEPLKSSVNPPKKLMETLIMVLQEHNEDI